jgi:hypothetical protein
MFVVSPFIAKRFPKRKYICCKMISFFNLISSKASDATPYGKAMMSDEVFFFKKKQLQP